jgi:TonB family protein
MTRRKPVLYSFICSVFFLTTVSGLLMLLPQRSRAQQADSARKLVEKAPAPYPALARTMGLQGTVKLDVLVSPDGAVKEVQIKGGHPVLAQAAVNSVRRWKWDAAAHESHETVEVKFTPE